MKGPKFGEINSQERLDGLVTGRIADRHVVVSALKNQ